MADKVNTFGLADKIGGNIRKNRAFVKNREDRGATKDMLKGMEDKTRIKPELLELKRR